MPAFPGVVSAIVVAYQPDYEKFRLTLARIIEQVYAVTIVDNSPDPNDNLRVQAIVNSIAEEFDLVVPGRPLLHLVTPGENIGLSRAYNLGIELAFRDGCDFVLLLDQDSVVTEGTVQTLLGHFDALREHLPVGAVSSFNQEMVVVSLPMYILVDKFRDSLRRRWKQGEPLLMMGGAHTERVFINSGTLIPLEVFSRIGGFDETLFLDAIDFEFSLRMTSAGYQIIAVDDARVIHEQGQPFRSSFLGKEVTLRTYPPIRTYHILKDTLLFGHKWVRRYPRVVTGIVATMVLNSLGALLLLPDKRNRIAQALQALWDFGHRSRTPIDLAIGFDPQGTRP